ncbi:extracellular solute-binding protein [Fredinandcohnia onubensis]|uniref:extracellular solute-binding protein n=2 Tax=Fredinandcohnia onubensis TaxID=1571209 RepID=UPI001FEAD000|nr:extracellular solute-binding protein [Fredinandcohnia onubensis]
MSFGKKNVKVLILLLLITVITLSGCNNKKSSGETGKKSMTIMTVLHNPEVPNDRIEKLLEEKSGMDLTFQWVPSGNYEEKINSAFATGTLPEAVYVGNTALYLNFKEAIRDGQFWEIGPYLKDFEHLSNLNQTIINNTAVDGKIYGLYQGAPLSRQGLIYRKDWADKLGLGTPETIDDIYKMAQAFTENDPDGNGKKDTIGITDRSDLVYGAFKSVSSWFGTPNNWGEKDGKLLPEFMFDEYLDTMDFIKDIREKGYMNSDFPVTSKDDQQALFKNGTAGMYIGAIGDVQGLYNDAVQLNPDVVLDVQNKITGPDGKFGIWAIPGYGNMVLFPKSSVETEKELKDILEFYDFIASPEGANLIYWGVEGEHYEVKDGKALVLDSDLSTREVKPYNSIQIGEAATNGRYDGAFTYDVKEKAEALTIDNEKYLIHDPTVPLDSPTFIEKSELLAQIIKDASYQYMLGDIDKEGFKDAIEKWKKSGGTDVINEFNESYKNNQ